MCDTQIQAAESTNGCGHCLGEQYFQTDGNKLLPLYKPEIRDLVNADTPELVADTRHVRGLGLSGASDKLIADTISGIVDAQLAKNDDIRCRTSVAKSTIEIADRRIADLDAQIAPLQKFRDTSHPCEQHSIASKDGTKPNLKIIPLLFCSVLVYLVYFFFGIEINNLVNAVLNSGLNLGESEQERASRAWSFVFPMAVTGFVFLAFMDDLMPNRKWLFMYRSAWAAVGIPTFLLLVLTWGAMAGGSKTQVDLMADTNGAEAAEITQRLFTLSLLAGVVGTYMISVFALRFWRYSREYECREDYRRVGSNSIMASKESERAGWTQRRREALDILKSNEGIKKTLSADYHDAVLCLKLGKEIEERMSKDKDTLKKLKLVA